jgi:hypothetical protein
LPEVYSASWTRRVTPSPVPDETAATRLLTERVVATHTNAIKSRYKPVVGLEKPIYIIFIFTKKISKQHIHE